MCLSVVNFSMFRINSLGYDLRVSLSVSKYEHRTNFKAMQNKQIALVALDNVKCASWYSNIIVENNTM